MSGMPEGFKVDPVKIDARIADYEQEAQIEERIAWALEEAAEDHHRKATDLRRQNENLLKTAAKYGYDPTHRCTGDLDCPARIHVHGCYADAALPVGHCDEPAHHEAEVNA